MLEINPFVYNAPVIGEDFFDREDVIRKILREVALGKTQGDVWISGERKTGKTSILHNLIQNTETYFQKPIKLYGTEGKFQPTFIYVDVQHVNNVDSFFEHLWFALKEKLNLEVSLKRSNYENTFKNLLKTVHSQHIFPIFLVDEFDAFLETLAIDNPKLARNFINKLNSLLKSFANKRHKVFSCVFTANQDFGDLNQKYKLELLGSGLITEVIELKWFSKNQIEQLAQKYLKNSHIKFTKNEINDVFKFTQGYPYFVQKIYHFIFEYKLEHQKNVPTIVIHDYAQYIYEQDVKFWLGQNLPPRTIKKLIELFKKIGDKAFDKLIDILIEKLTQNLTLCC